MALDPAPSVVAYDRVLGASLVAFIVAGDAESLAVCRRAFTGEELFDALAPQVRILALRLASTEGVVPGAIGERMVGAARVIDEIGQRP